MPCGKTHDRITVVAAAAAGPAWWCLTPAHADLSVGLTLVAATLFSGLLLSPDLDLNSCVYHRWGPLRCLWFPYQKLVPHRSRYSHSYVLAPVLRVLYFLVMLFVLLQCGTWLAAQFMRVDRGAVTRAAASTFLAFWRTHPHHLEMAAVGVFLGSALHCSADFCSTTIKRRLR
jgi:uncharacterized metal-binding protein